jgi:Protein of unknown function (DUF2909)
MTYLVIFAFVAILGSLGVALYFMLHGSEEGKQGRMAWALAARIGLSVLLFIGVLIAWKLGYIQPTGIPAGK